MSGFLQGEEIAEFEEEEDTKDEDEDTLTRAFRNSDPDTGHIVVHRHRCLSLETDEHEDCDCMPVLHLVRGAKA